MPENGRVMISCGEATKLSDGFIDKELPAALHSEILRHLLECAGCAAFIRARAGVQRLVRASVKSLATPAGLRFRVLGQMRA